jgi:succinate--hydroxymethylglutarate CoA-transferase
VPQLSPISKVNRNKTSLGLSFSHLTGVAIHHQLSQNCDVLVENHLPSSLAKFQLNYATMAKLNPSLIYASVTGYGQNGPYRDRAGYDVMVEAEMGLMHISGEKDRPPVKVGVAVTDISTGMYIAIGVLVPLYSRRDTGLGQWFDASRSDCQVACLVTEKTDSARWGTAHGMSKFSSDRH